jgi:hypothetical protein
MTAFLHSFLRRKGAANREVQMAHEFAWHESYGAALLETDWVEIVRRIQKAESAIAERKHALSLNHGGTPKERDAIAAALSGLTILRGDVAEWRSR